MPGCQMANSVCPASGSNDHRSEQYIPLLTSMHFWATQSLNQGCSFAQSVFPGPVERVCSLTYTC